VSTFEAFPFSSRLSAFAYADKNPRVPIVWEKDTPTIVVDIEGMSRRLILDTGSSVSILQPGTWRREVQSSRAEPFGLTRDVPDIKGQQTVSFPMNGRSFEHTSLVSSIPNEADSLIGMDLISILRIVLHFDQGTMTWCRKQSKPRRGKVLTTTQTALTIFSKGQDGRSPKLETPKAKHMDEQFQASPAMEAKAQGVS
jgi:hypothetical protein